MTNFVDEYNRTHSSQPTDSERYLHKVAGSLRYFRVQRRWSQSQLSIKSSVPVSTISNIESGRRNPTVTTLYLLAKGLDIPLHILLAE